MRRKERPAEESEEIVEEFTRKRFPKKTQREELMKKVVPAKDLTEETVSFAASWVEADPREGEIATLRERWMEELRDIWGNRGLKLPPLREINHTIPLIDENKKYHYRLPKCPDSLKPQLSTKIKEYIAAGLWRPVHTHQAAPMMCLPKKDLRLRTVVDGRPRNENTVKDVTPFPDQDQIRLDVARARCRSKIDLTDAYEQVRVEPSDVWKTAFSTVYGTFVSEVMQQGDCNAPSTFQRIMNMVFRDFIGVFMHAYLDDLFVFSDTVEDHERHLGLVFAKIREHEFFLKETKVELYAPSMDCLGHVIDDRGLHADVDKMEKIREWRSPRNYHDVQRFLGMIQYLAPFLPGVALLTDPLSAMTKGGTSFEWRPVHEICFQRIKDLCCKTPVLKPIDPARDEPIWIICDASVSGVGAMYGQGPDWQHCRPAGFMSRKFSDSQRNYRVFEQEMLAILEALLKWEDKLMGYRIHVVTDHKALEFFKTQGRLSGRQTRWMEYLSRFDFDIRYVKGVLNKVADALSRYYESDTWNDRHDASEFVNADRRLDPGLEDLPPDRRDEVVDEVVEMMAMDVAPNIRRSRRLERKLQERTETRDIEAADMAEAPGNIEVAVVPKPPLGKEVCVADAVATDATLNGSVDVDNGLRDAIIAGYVDDPLFSKVLAGIDKFRQYSVVKGLIVVNNRAGERVVCVPQGKLGERTIRGAIIEQAHEVVGHFGPHKTSEYIRRSFWWPGINALTEKFCASCAICARAKPSNQKPAGLLHSLPVPDQPWESIGMDFIGPFPEAENKNYLWVVMCRLTSMVHLIPIRTDTTATELSEIFIKEIVRLHGLPRSIVSDRDSKFTSRWWREVHRLLGAKLLMSTAFHPQTDGATERVNRSIGQILRSVVRPDQRDWVTRCPMVEFAINTSVSATTGHPPFAVNYGYSPHMIRTIPPELDVHPGVVAFANRAIHYLADAHDGVIASRVFQTHFADKGRSNEPNIATGDLVYLSTKNLNTPRNRAGKLVPKFVGPYRVTATFPTSSVYELELPEELTKRRIHPRFHVSLLRPHYPSDSERFPGRSNPDEYDFGAPDDVEWHVEEILDHRKVKGKWEFLVKFTLVEPSWEPLSTCRTLAAMDRYLELMGVSRIQDLPTPRRVQGK